MSSTTRTVRNVLSIDGCGFRGLTQLLVLEELMKQHSRDPDAPSRPCDVFDLICGTATGGLIAILLGRLQMTCERAIEAYSEIEEAIFGETRTIGAILGNSFNHDRFGPQLDKIIAQARVDGLKLPVNAPMLADAAHNGKCRTLVTAMSTATAVDADAERIRSYERLADPVTIPERPLSIRDATLKTASCPSLFPPLDLGEFGSFMAASTSGFSNPSMIAYLEAQDIWGKDAELALISLGMGLRERHDYRTLSDEDIKKMIKKLGVVVTSEDERLSKLISHTQLVATSTQVKHVRLQVLIDRNPKQKYMRLDPYRKPDRDHLTFVDYVQQENVQNIVKDFIQGYLKERFDKAVDFIQGVQSKWIRVQGYTCDIGETVQWNPPQDLSTMSLGRIMRECLLWEQRDRNRSPISCFAVRMTSTPSNTVQEVEMKTGGIHLFPDDDRTLFVRVLLDDQWRFFPQSRAPGDDWVDESTENSNAARDPIEAIQYASRLTNFEQIKAFRSDGLYTTSNVNREEVNIYETSFDLPYHGTWVRTSTA